MKTNWLAVAAFVAALGVLLGAFGTHIVKDSVSVGMLAIFETGVRYQMYHAFGLIVVSWTATLWPNNYLIVASGWLFTIGLIIFCTSLYLMVLTDARWLGAITPVGGLCLILGWLAIALAALRGDKA
jgi:uncharacterized membrane protein YgdD (TMEM256/DUF423 family)